jgi:hypothetical protein
VEDNVQKNIPRVNNSPVMDTSNFDIQSLLSSLNLGNVSSSKINSLLNSGKVPIVQSSGEKKVEEGVKSLTPEQMNEIKSYIDFKFDQLQKYIDDKIEEKFQHLNKI